MELEPGGGATNEMAPSGSLKLTIIFASLTLALTFLGLLGWAISPNAPAVFSSALLSPSPPPPVIQEYSPPPPLLGPAMGKLGSKGLKRNKPGKGLLGAIKARAHAGKGVGGNAKLAISKSMGAKKAGSKDGGTVVRGIGGGLRAGKSAGKGQGKKGSPKSPKTPKANLRRDAAAPSDPA